MSARFVQVPFDEAVRDATGGNKKVPRKHYLTAGALPVIDQGQDAIAGYVDDVGTAYRGTLPVVLFGDHTKAFKYADEPFALGADGVKVLEPRTGFEARFLYYYFRTVRLPDAGYSRHFKFLREATIPKPPREEQRRIVELLTRAEGIVRLRRHTLTLGDATVPSLFANVFGNVATNSAAWPLKTIGDVVERADYGTSRKASADGTGVPVIRMGNVTYEGALALDDLKYVVLENPELEKYKLRPGDLLFNRTNSKELVGKTGLWTAPFEAVAASYFIRIQIREGVIRPVYLWAFMNSRYMKKRLVETARGAIGQANINTKELAAFPIPLPPIELQRAFEARYESVQSIIGQMLVGLAKAEELLQSLLHRAFQGEL